MEFGIFVVGFLFGVIGVAVTVYFQMLTKLHNTVAQAQSIGSTLIGALEQVYGVEVIDPETGDKSWQFTNPVAIAAVAQYSTDIQKLGK